MRDVYLVKNENFIKKMNEYLSKIGLQRLVSNIKQWIDGKLDKSGGTISGDLAVSGTITGDVDGVAKMASKIPYTAYTGTSSTIAVNNVEGFPSVLEIGACIRIRFSAASFASACTLNVNGTGAKVVVFEGTGIGERGVFQIYGVYTFTFDGTYWRCEDAHQLYVGTSTVGSTTQPIYLSSGKPTQCGLKLSQLEVVETLPTTGLVEGRQVLFNGFPFTYDGENWISTTEDLGGREETHAEEFVFQPTGGADLSVKDGYASIRKIKGNTLVWNQLVKNNTFEDASNWIFKSGLSVDFTGDGVILTKFQTTPAGVGYMGQNIRAYQTGHKYLFYITAKSDTLDKQIRFGTNNYRFSVAVTLTSEFRRYAQILTYNLSTLPALLCIIWLSPNVTLTDDFVVFVKSCGVVDLTQMFGVGNEPSTVEEFEAMFPNAYYDYDEGELLSFEGSALKSVGFNAFDGENAVVLKGQTYYLGGTYETLQFKADGEAAVDVAVPSDKLYTPESNGELYATGTDICINLSHSGYRNGEYEPYKEFILSLDFIKTIADGEGNVLFPNGLQSAGTACDEIVYDEGLGKYKAVKRVGSMDMGDINYSYTSAYDGFFSRLAFKNYCQFKTVKYPYKGEYRNVEDKQMGYIYITSVFVRDSTYGTDAAAFKQSVSGQTLLYELETPVEVVLEDVDLSYMANDFGTEEIVGNTTPIIPMRADIRYNFNAVDMIRGNYFSMQQQKKRLNDQSNEIDQLQSQMEQLDETYIPLSQKGVANGVATLGADGIVPEAQLPEISGANNVLNFDNADAFPTEGDKSVLYVASEEKKVYAWTGSQYFAVGEYENATTTSPGLMSASDKAKLDNIDANANNYTLPTAGRNTLGGVKTTSSVTSATGYTACPIISGVPYYKDTVGVDASVPTFEEHSDVFDIDFSEHYTQYIEVTQGGSHSVSLTMPSSGVYRVTFANYSEDLLHLDLRNPGVGKFVVPQNPACDYGSAMTLVIVYVEGSYCSISMEYPQIVVR